MLKTLPALSCVPNLPMLSTSTILVLGKRKSPPCYSAYLPNWEEHPALPGRSLTVLVGKPTGKLYRAKVGKPCTFLGI